MVCLQSAVETKLQDQHDNVPLIEADHVVDLIHTHVHITIGDITAFQTLRANRSLWISEMRGRSRNQ